MAAFAEPQNVTAIAKIFFVQAKAPCCELRQIALTCKSNSAGSNGLGMIQRTPSRR